MRDFLLFILSFPFICFYSCHEWNYESRMPDMHEGLFLLEESPDSLAHILETQVNPLLLPDSSKADYWWMLTHAHFKQGRSLVNDSLILFTLRYDQEKQSPRLATTYMLAAMQLYDKPGRGKEVEQYLLASNTLAEACHDTLLYLKNLHTLIGLYYTGQQQQKQLAVTHKIEKWLPEGNPEVFYMAGLSFMRTGQPDSVRFYIRKALNLAEISGNTHLEKFIVRNYASYVIDIAPKESLAILQDCQSRYGDDKDFYIPLAHAWARCGNNDSSLYYIDKEERNGIGSLAHENIVKALRLLLEDRAGKPFSLSYIGQYNDSIQRIMDSSIQNGVARAEDQHRLVLDNLQLELKKSSQQKNYLYVCVCLLLLVGVLVFIYQRRLLMKERMLQQVRERLRSYQARLNENERIIRQNEESIRSISEQLNEDKLMKEHQTEYLTEIEAIKTDNQKLQDENRKLHHNMVQYEELLQLKSAEKNNYDNMAKHYAYLVEREKFLSLHLLKHVKLFESLRRTPRYIQEEEWTEIIETVNFWYDNFTKRLQSDFPSLTENDLQICCLMKLQLPTSAIAELYSIAPSSATKRKQRIKERINMNLETPLDKDHSIDVFLWNY